MTTLFPVLLASAFATSVLSGVLGMGGGMILMGVYGMLLPVTAAMVLHGITQVAANGLRAWLLRPHVRLGVLGPYLVGALVSTAAMSLVAFVPSKAGVLLALGALPWIRLVLPERLGVDVERPRDAFTCGLVVNAVQLTAGVAGPLVDLFFLETRMDRREIVATKAVTQTLSHLLKLGYYLAWTAGATELGSWWIVPGVVLASNAGTRLGKAWLERLSERQFRAAAGRLLLAIGGIYAFRGVVELLR